MNRFFDIDSFALAQWMPSKLRAAGKPLRPALFNLINILRMRSDICGGVIAVPAAFTTDLASVPEEAWGLLAPDDPVIAAGAVVHDFLCDNAGTIPMEGGATIHITSEQAARVLAYEAMSDLLASEIQQKLVFLAVNEFGPHWE